MARYRGPKAKIARKFNEPIFGPSKAVSKKPYGPGQHGRGRRRKHSEYATQLAAKQKAKYTYGVLEKQFRRMFEIASARDGITGEILLKNLEARLDNVVFRFGIAPTRRAARQLVTHKHIVVNGGILNVPSYSVKPGDVIGVREKSKSLVAITESLAQRASLSRKNYNWLEWNSEQLEGKFINYPDRESIPENIEEQLIVELYSK